MSVNLTAAREAFIIEAQELLADMESALLSLEKNPGSQDEIHRIFRVVHTVKGSAGLFGFDNIVSFAHVAENLLDKLRRGEIIPAESLIALLLQCHDFLKSIVEFDTTRSGMPMPDDLIEIKINLEAGLKKYSTSPGGMEPESMPAALSLAGPAGVQKPPAAPALLREYILSLRFKKDTFFDGFDPFSFIAYLKKLGEIKGAVPFTADIPDLRQGHPEECHLGFEIYFVSGASREAIVEVFEFVSQDCDVQVMDLQNDGGQIRDWLHKNESSGADLREIWACLCPQAAHLWNSAPPPPARLSPAAAVSIIPDAEKLPESPDNIDKKADRMEEHLKQVVRIDAKKLDSLINLVGELVIRGANVKQLAEKIGSDDLTESTHLMSRLVEEVRDHALKIRMVQIGQTFRRFERLVHDMARKMHKSVTLEITGGDTELDKTVVDKISDPLTHLVRNAVDHAMESPEERSRAGKEPLGRITLNAFHDTGTIVIEIIDDGRGLSRAKILEKAVVKGLVNPALASGLSDAEVYQFIFEPGFSTAEQVTDISGRGVGMDVVKKNVQVLRGSVELESTECRGTTVRIRLPLTLAIIDGFLVRVNEQFYVIPLDMVMECIDMSAVQKVENHGADFINLRGEVLSYLRLSDFFLQKKNARGRGKENAIVVKYGSHKAGLVVDELLGEFQTVIKPLGKIFQYQQWLSGATILGNGDVGIIIDVPRLIQAVQSGLMDSIRDTVRAN